MDWPTHRPECVGNWDGQNRTDEMQESKSCALPLGDIPLNPAINQRNTA